MRYYVRRKKCIELSTCLMFHRLKLVISAQVQEIGTADVRTITTVPSHFAHYINRTQSQP